MAPTLLLKKLLRKNFNSTVHATAVTGFLTSIVFKNDLLESALLLEKLLNYHPHLIMFLKNPVSSCNMEDLTRTEASVPF